MQLPSLQTAFQYRFSTMCTTEACQTCFTLRSGVSSIILETLRVYMCVSCRDRGREMFAYSTSTLVLSYENLLSLSRNFMQYSVSLFFSLLYKRRW